MNLQKLSWAFTGLIASGVCIGGGAPAHAINLVSNGSFETDVVTTGNAFPLAPNGISGWTLSNTAEIFRNGHPSGLTASDGFQFLEMDSTANYSISQTLSNLTNGQTYKLSFDYSPRPTFAANTNGLNVSLDAQQIFSIASDGTSLSSVNWSSYGYQFTATASPVVLQFSGAGLSDSAGALLDNVSVEAVPAPLPILGSGAALGYFRKMRGQSRRLRLALESQGQG